MTESVFKIKIGEKILFFFQCKIRNSEVKGGSRSENEILRSYERSRTKNSETVALFFPIIIFGRSLKKCILNSFFETGLNTVTGG